MITRIFLFAAILLITASAAIAQTVSIQKISMDPAETTRIIQKVTDNERRFRGALTEYVFSRSATVQTVGIGGNITGTYRRDSEMMLTPEGKRIERITYFPISTLTEISMTAEDLEDLGGVNPFALEPAEVGNYNFAFVGKERIDELYLYVFDVTPKVVPDPKKSKQRLFTGRIWVDVDDLMIVKSKGKAVPETKDNKFPVVETWRENIDGKYWFPAYTSSDDELDFDGRIVKLRVRVKYNDYKLGRSEVKILTEEEVVEPTPSPSPKKP